MYLVLPTHVRSELLRRAGEVHATGLKSYGLFAAHPDSPGYPYTADEVVFFDPAKNRRNDAHLRPAFEAQGRYFRAYDDAGFVADSGELLTVHRRLEEAGLEPVGMFHSHRRQPANFSHIDFRLHNPAYPWHLIVSFASGAEPVVRAFGVTKTDLEFGIGADDRNEGSEQSYPGPEVVPLALSVV
jgi:proteasome lid subunit RPN8/RPN11